MPKVKVCHFTSVHPVFDTRIFCKECKSLAEAGYNTYLVATNCEAMTIDGIQILPVDSSFHRGRLMRMLSTAWSTYRAAKKINADIYHFHDPELLPYGLLIKWQGRKVIYDVHEDVPEDILIKEWIPIFFRRMIANLFELFENWAARHMNMVVAATPFIADRFLKLGCRSITINNYPIVNELHLPDWDRKERAVCYVGSICDTRGIFEIIEAIGRTKAELLLAGEFSPLNQREKASLLPGWAKVEELGYLNRMGVKQTLSRSMAGLVLLHPVITYINSLPVKMFEYMSAGIPVIASNFPLWKEIIEKNKCGICVNPLDVHEIADAITWVINHPEEARIMGENGRLAVVERYNWENEFRKLQVLYEELS